ncbi:MAG: protein translocase subunit SecD [Anaerolineae bacterium]|nr:protein translocase subunit SecD [Anaerolineae bacterium]
MTRRDITLLILIVVVAGLAVYTDLGIDHPAWFEALLFWQPENARSIDTHYGLDLQGGLQVLLTADVADDVPVESASMQTARQIIENRVNSLGLTEPVVQTQGDRRIIVELPGIDDPQVAVDMIRETALLEFVDAGYGWLPDGTLVATSLGAPTVSEPTIGLTATGGLGDDQAPITSIGPVTSTGTFTTGLPVYETVLTGAALRQVGLTTGEYGGYEIPFELYPEAAQVFAQYTASHVGQYLCIVLDKRVITCPSINSQIPDGRGVITLGGSSLQEAQNLTIQLQYGALPVPMRLETTNSVGPTLGEISIDRSIRAGIIGLSVVLLFMLVYYRLPGGLADIALLIYAALNLAVYRLAPVTLTLPGIAGFLLSAGMAVDANILVFERMKEELRAGRPLDRAIEAGFSRAWTSIRDSQFSTILICIVLYFFGINFGASVVKGFALTLFIGTVTNLFTAVVATRTFIRLVFHLAGDWLQSHRWLLGV